MSTQIEQIVPESFFDVLARLFPVSCLICLEVYFHRGLFVDLTILPVWTVAIALIPISYTIGVLADFLGDLILNILIAFYNHRADKRTKYKSIRTSIELYRTIRYLHKDDGMRLKKLMAERVVIRTLFLWSVFTHLPTSLDLHFVPHWFLVALLGCMTVLMERHVRLSI